MRIADNKLIHIGRSLFRNILIVVIDIIPMHGFENQQHDSIVLSRDLLHRLLRHINTKLMQRFFVLFRQLPHFHMLGAGHFIRIK